MDLQQQSKALDKLTDHVEDLQLDSTRVHESMALIAVSKEADLNAMRLSQPSTQSFFSPFPATTTTFRNAFSGAAISPNFNVSSQQPSMPFGGQNPSANVVPESIPSVQNMQNISHSNSNEYSSIWFKDEWRAGEIPEEAVIF
ncbi:hypothetical protein L1987_22886 [Smallanthus sonchifolius]|uniref:Uncharacterized protein n=1 Tax=Smallanthus sonchifolius TaxID=185202 RepID=A0ACB9IHJ9_9ASTR|nr:hypothetical protein L1987_22886 [Smallanthus sonchifolius]